MQVNHIDNAIQGYNQVISAYAMELELAYVDTYSELVKLESGIVTDGIILTSTFVTGNAFSLDGIHLTQIGSAYVANLFIQAINAKYGSTLPLVSVTEYQGVILP